MEPQDPTAGNPFDQLALTSLDSVTIPADADRVQVDAYQGGWILGTPGPTATLPAAATPDLVTGLRFTFTSSTGALIQPGQSATMVLTLEQRDPPRNDHRAHND